MFHICSVVVKEDKPALEMEDSDSDDLADLLDQGGDEDEDEGERLNTEEEEEEENWVTDHQILERGNSDSEGGEEDDMEEQRAEESRVLQELPTSCSTPCLLCKQSQVEGVRLGLIYR